MSTQLEDKLLQSQEKLFCEVCTNNLRFVSEQSKPWEFARYSEVKAIAEFVLKIRGRLRQYWDVPKFPDQVLERYHTERKDDQADARQS